MASLPPRDPASAQADDRDQPAARHDPQSLRVHPHLRHDPGRSWHRDDDPSALRIPGGLRVPPARLRHGDLARPGADRRRLLAPLRPGVEEPGMSAVQARSVAAENFIVVPYRRLSVAALATNVVLILLGCFFLLPMLWMVFASLDSNPDWAIKLPSLTLTNFTEVLSRADALSSFRSSLILAGTTTVLTTVLALLAAYPLSRMHIPFKRSFMLAILFASGLPVSMLIVPVYQMYVYFGWLDSLYTTALFLAASSLPFAIWLMKNFIDAVPAELEQAAAIDGASTFRILRELVLPLTLPGIAVTGIYTFINAWGAFIIPFVLTYSPDNQPGPVEIYNFMGSHGLFKFGDLAVFSLLFSVAVIVLYLFMSRYFSGAFNFGGAV